MVAAGGYLSVPVTEIFVKVYCFCKRLESYDDMIELSNVMAVALGSILSV